MDKGGQLVNATRFAAMTGVSRERLRTWERRHGFPVPSRTGGGPRRYALADAPRVVAVRRALEGGIPLPHAVEKTASLGGAPEVHEGDLAAAAEHAPGFLALVSGPEPLRIAWLNTAARVGLGATRAGDDLARAAPWLPGSRLEEALHALFTADVTAVECEHPAWGDAPGEMAHALVFRLPVGAGDHPLVGVLDVDPPAERRLRAGLAELSAERELLRRQGELQGRWLQTLAELADQFRRGAGGAILEAATGTLVAQLGAVDAAVAPYVAGQLVLGSSGGALLGPRMVDVTPFSDLAAALREDHPRWLEGATAAAFGVPEELHAVAAPVRVAGEPLGIVLLAFAERAALGEDAERLLAIVAAGVGFAMLRDRFIEVLRGGESR